jgi:hypothetical protein
MTIHVDGRYSKAKAKAHQERRQKDQEHWATQYSAKEHGKEVVKRRMDPQKRPFTYWKVAEDRQEIALSQ